MLLSVMSSAAFIVCSSARRCCWETRSGEGFRCAALSNSATAGPYPIVVSPSAGERGIWIRESLVRGEGQVKGSKQDTLHTYRGGTAADTVCRARSRRTRTDGRAARHRARWSLFADWCIGVGVTPLPADRETLIGFVRADPAACRRNGNDWRLCGRLICTSQRLPRPIRGS